MSSRHNPPSLADCAGGVSLCETPLVRFADGWLQRHPCRLKDPPSVAGGKSAVHGGFSARSLRRRPGIAYGNAFGLLTANSTTGYTAGYSAIPGA
jgi:hypothetical protein